MFFKRLTTFFIPLLALIGLELIFFDIDLIYYLGPLLLLILLYSIKFISDRRIFGRQYWDFSILPLLLFINLTFTLFIISSILFRHVLILAFSVTLFFYLENIFYSRFYEEKYQRETFENFSLFLNLSVFFLTAVNLNAIGIFLNAPFWLVSLILILVNSLLGIQLFWSNKITNKFRFAYLLVLNLIALEFFWCINFLPANFYVNSAVITILYYFIWEIFKARLNEKLEAKLIWRYAVLTVILMLLLILTSRWI
ncbi:MAG: hypothetical protein PHC97_04335 [Patescibacteria group bacterium]|nr:hypothetical protein [Patescibacteria group bacterium]